MRASTRARIPASARWLLLLVLPLLAACQAVQFASLNTSRTPSGVGLRRDLVFDSAHGLALDAYVPTRAAHAPIVVFFYGGDWTHGERGWYRFIGNALAGRGLVAVIPDYRKVPDVAPDGFMTDAARAVAWTRAHAAELGGDPDDIFVMGHSAGGHIAALLATDPQWLGAVGMSPRDLAGGIGLAGIYLFLPADSEDDDMLAVFGEDDDTRQESMPLNAVRGTEPPMLLLHGRDDDEVDPANSRLFAQALRAQGEEADLRLYAEVDHGQLLFALSPHRGAPPVLDDVRAFVRAHPRAARTAGP